MHTQLGLHSACRTPGGDCFTIAPIAKSFHAPPFGYSISSASQNPSAKLVLSVSFRKEGHPHGWIGNFSEKTGREEGRKPFECAGAGNNCSMGVAEQVGYSCNGDPDLGCEPLPTSLLPTPNLNISFQVGAFGVEVPTGMESWDSDVPPQSVSFATNDEFALVERSILALQSCRKLKNLVHARAVYLYICNSGVETHKAVENYIVPMFVECGSILEAQVVFNKLSCCREHSWTSLISGYCDSGQNEHAVFIFRQMQQEQESRSVHTFVTLLTAFTSCADLGKGREIHIEVVKEGLEKDTLVGNSLVGFYSRCGAVTEAVESFTAISVQDSASWTALIQGYSEHGPCEEALILFEKMKLKGIMPGRPTYTYSLKACGNIGAIDEGCELLMELAMKGLEGDIFTGSTLVYMFLKCGYLAEAQDVFDKLPSRDVVLWNTLLGGYVNIGASHQALACYGRMKREGIFPDITTHVMALKASSSIGALQKGREIHTEITVVGFESDAVVCSSLVSMYASCGSLLEAQSTLHHSFFNDVSAWTSLIAGYADYGPAQEALACLENMQSEGIFPDAVAFACSLKACSSLGAIDEGQEIHMDLTKRGFEKELPVSKAMVSMYAKFGLVLETQKSCDNLVVQDVVTWTAQVGCYAEHGQIKDALTCFTQMQVEGIAPNAITFVCVLRACSVSKSVKKGQELHMEVVLKGCEDDLLVGNSLIGMYLNCGSFVDAKEVFATLQAKDVVSWNTLITGFMEQGCDQEALNAFEEMQHEGHSPDAVTLVCILKVCGSVGALGKGRDIHMTIRQGDLDGNCSVANSLISMYANCGSLIEAQEVFDNLLDQDVVTWSTMIKAYGMNHEGDKAVQFFKDMLEQGVKPDAVTFSCLLLACSHASLISEGQGYLKEMREHYGIVPTVEHYSCVVDLLARSGRLYEAESFILMACPSSKVTWGSLLSGCKTYNEVELGSRCFEKLMEMNAELASWYVNMAGIYATAGRWDAVKRVENLRKHMGAAKKPASATIEVNNIVHVFVVGNKENAEVSDLLSSLGSRFKEEGHLPNLESILKSGTDERKDAALCEHAEKMALAFGLLNTAPGVTLRVSKNLRMCNDCHSTSKILSKVERREIMLHDDCCIHHFKDGVCSCGDNF